MASADCAAFTSIAARATMVLLDMTRAYCCLISDPANPTPIAGPTNNATLPSVVKFFANKEMVPATIEEAETALSAVPTNCIQALDSSFTARPMVFGILSYWAWISFAEPLTAAKITPVVSLPSSAILRSSPRVLPRCFCNTSRIIGACSATELNSSPRNAPAAIPCES